MNIPKKTRYKSPIKIVEIETYKKSFLVYVEYSLSKKLLFKQILKVTNLLEISCLIDFYFSIYLELAKLDSCFLKNKKFSR